MRILVHADEYYPTAQACSYRMQVFVDTFMALGDEVTVVTSSANMANGTIDKTLHQEKIIYSPAIRMKKKTTVMRIYVDVFPLDSAPDTVEERAKHAELVNAIKRKIYIKRHGVLR